MYVYLPRFHKSLTHNNILIGMDLFSPPKQQQFDDQSYAYITYAYAHSINSSIYMYRYYLTANSCYHDGYLEYNWPERWGGNTGTSTGHCGEVSPEGGAVPEQFW